MSHPGCKRSLYPLQWPLGAVKEYTKLWPSFDYIIDQGYDHAHHQEHTNAIEHICHMAASPACISTFAVYCSSYTMICSEYHCNCYEHDLTPIYHSVHCEFHVVREVIHPVLETWNE